MTAILHNLTQFHHRLIQVAEQRLQFLLQFAVEIAAFVLLWHELVHPTALSRIGRGMIVVELGQFGGFLYGVVQTAELIHEFDLQRIGSEPYTTLGDGIHLGGLHTTAFRHDIQERQVAAVDIGL